MRKHLEEATNDITLPNPFVENPEIQTDIKPLKFHSAPNSVKEGNIMAWNCSQVEFVFTPSPNHKVTSSNFFLKKSASTIELFSGGKSFSKLEDVSDIKINVTSIVKNAEFEEIFAPGPNPNAVATVVEMNITMSPPKGYLAENLKIGQSHKFRANVGSSNDSSPSY